MDNKEATQFLFSLVDKSANVITPNIKENGRKQWVEWDSGDNFFKYLIDIYYERSIAHKTITSRKIDMISGNGFEETTDIALNEFIKNRADDETLTSIVKKITFDYELTGSFSLGIIWNGDGTKISQIYHIPIHSVKYDRDYYISKAEKYFWICNDWTPYGVRKNPPTRMQEFSNKYKNEKNQILYHKKDNNGQRWYSIPEYYGAFKYILSEYDISDYQYTNINDSFSGDFMISFNDGIPSPEQMDLQVKAFEQKYKGTKGSKMIVAFSSGKEHRPELSKIDHNTSDTRYKDLNDLIRQNIFVAHGIINPMLYGVFVPGQLGGRLELEESLQIFQSVYINYRQLEIESVLNSLAKINGIQTPIKLKKYTI